MISARVNRLREKSLQAKPTLSVERAELMTRFYQRDNSLRSTPMQRALSFAYLLDNKSIWIGEDELIVGEKGPAPKATPTYPELCCHSLDDLAILDKRPKISFRVSQSTHNLYANEIIPFWEGKSMRELIFKEMNSDWIAAYEAGIFTEFMEQRAPGHTVLDNKIYDKGMVDFIDAIDLRLASLDYLNNPDSYEQQEQLKAMRICALALIQFAERHAQAAERLAENESDPARKKELEQIAAICRKVPAHAPETFWEALQYYWFVHLGVTIELNTWDAFDPGRLDQHLYPFYIKGTSDGSLSDEFAKELLHCFWIKFNNQPAPPKVGVTAEESGTYTDFAQINVGGIQKDGTDGVNPVSYLLLDVIEEMRLLQPSSSIQVSKHNPDSFIKRATKIIKTGFGQPSVFNADLIVQELVRQGKTLEDARQGGSSGCVEVGAFGKENYNLTGYFNLPKVFEITLNNGIDPSSGKQIGVKTTNLFDSFETLFTAFEQQLKHFIDIKVRGNHIIERLYAKYMPAPFLSLMIDDCIAKGKDYHDGGARYNTSYIQGVGLGSITDSMTAVKYHIFDRRTITIDELLNALKTNYSNQERLRQMLLNHTPRYGNDDDYADSVMYKIFKAYFDAVEGRKNTKGGEYHINLLPTTVHVYFGSVTQATADGRKAGQPLSEGISPVQGADLCGPTAVLNSAAKIDHVLTGGTLLNQKFSPQLFTDELGLDNLVQLIRTYFHLDGHHIQFNVIDVKTLRAAQLNPEAYKDLIVRVAGYSDYFCDLSIALQEEIIQRTEYNTF